jgi:hypothetical protein
MGRQLVDKLESPEGFGLAFKASPLGSSPLNDIGLSIVADLLRG